MEKSVWRRMSTLDKTIAEQEIQNRSKVQNAQCGLRDAVYGVYT